MQSNSLNSLAYKNPELAVQWHSTKNGLLKPTDVSCGSGRKVWWQCSKGIDHQWQATVHNRNEGSACPFCINKRVSTSNSLAAVRTDLAKEWHPTKNGNLTPSDITVGSGKKVWWQCLREADHEWISTIRNRNQGLNCPFCANRKVSTTNSLANIRPDLVQEWHPTKNGNLMPHTIVAGSGRRVWWKCPEGKDHEWQAIIYERTQGAGCPYCSKHKVSETNSLVRLRPDIAK